MCEKLYDIANNDLEAVFFSLEKIRATSQSAHSYLDNLICEPSAQTNTVLCMFRVIEDLANSADNQLTIAADKLFAIYKEKEAAK